MDNKPKIYKLLPKQNEFLKSTAKETLMSGSWGSSKSFALGLAILKEASIPGSQILLCRKTYTALKRSTLQTLLYGDNPIIPRGSYKFNKIDQTITLNGLGSVIYLMGLDDIMKVRSMNLSFVAVDEASELEEQEWLELRGRLRSQVGSRRIVGATNPSTPSSWLYQRFYVNKDSSRQVIESTTLDNIYLPKDYIESLKSMPQNLYDKFVLGKWIALEKAVYGEFDRNKHLKERNLGEFNKYLLGVDFGFTNPCAMALMGIDGDNNIHLIEEQKESKLLIGKIVQLAERYQKLEPLVIVDPSAPALIAEFEQNGFNVIKADNSVDSGIARMQDYLFKGKFSADPKCLEFIKEVENYIRDDNGKVVKINDHLMDAIRYCVNNMVDDKCDYIKPMLITSDEDIEEEDDF